MKRQFALFMVFMMMFTMLAVNPVSAADEEGDVFPLEETYTVTALAFANIGNELDNTLFMKTMEEMTNIHFEISSYSEAELEEKRNLSLNSGEYPDVLIKSGISAADAFKYGSEQEILIPLNDLIEEYMPNLKALLDERDLWDAITSADGNIYALPQIQERGMAAPSVFINKAWLDNLGLEVPQTAEDFMEVMRAIKAGDANGDGNTDDEYPIYCPSGAVEYTFPIFGICMDYNTYSSYDGEEITFIPTSEQYKEFLRFWAQAYTEGLINSDCFSASWDDINAIGAVGDTLGTIPTWGVYQHVGAERSLDYVELLPFDEANTIPVSAGISYGGLAITDACEYPELVAQWADYLYSVEGSRLARYGVEGETYNVKDENLVDWIVDKGYGTNGNEISNSQTLYGWYPAPMSGINGLKQGNPEEVYLTTLRENLLTRAGVPFPSLSWTEEEITQKADLCSVIYPYYYEYMAEVITGRKDLDATWDEYIDNLNKMGVETLNEIDAAAYARYLEG